MHPPFGKNDVQILAGSFDDYSFDDVMQVLGLSRQCLRLKVRRGDSPLSEVVLKAGKVLDARMPPDQTDPLMVFQAINGGAVRGSGVSFIVYHTEPSGVYPAPCGELAELYDKVKAAPQVKAAPPPQPPKQAATAPAPAAKREPEYAPTVQVPAPAVAPLQAGSSPPQAAISSASDISVVANIVAKMVLAELQPLIHRELAELARQMQEQAHLTHKLDGRLESLPQIVSAEVRAALANPR